MDFSKFIGQKHIAKLLLSQLTEGTIGHAYLFVGSKGQGKSTLARIFAGGILCENPQMGRGPCGACLSCQKIKKSIHPDLAYLGGDQGKIKIDDTRKLKEAISFRPSEGSKKIYILENVDDMTRESGNSMLKVLEDPPPYAVFILTALTLDSILPTIQSRCEVYKFQPLTGAELKAYLSKEYDCGSQELELAVAFSGGMLQKARSLLEEDYADLIEESLQLCMELNHLSAADLLDWADYISRSDHVQEFLDLMSTILRDHLVYQLSGTDRNVFYKKGLSGNLSTPPEITYNILEIITQTINQLSTNTNKELALEAMLLEIKEVISSGTVYSRRCEV